MNFKVNQIGKKSLQHHIKDDIQVQETTNGHFKPIYMAKSTTWAQLTISSYDCYFFYGHCSKRLNLNTLAKPKCNHGTLIKSTPFRPPII